MPVKRIPFRLFAPAIVFTVFALLTSVSPANAGCSAKSDGNGLCPFRVGGKNVFDRCFGAPPIGPKAGKPTSFGNSVCNSLKKAREARIALGNSSRNIVNSVKRDTQDFIKVTMKGSINPNSIAAYNRAAKFPNRLKAEIGGYLSDRKCGSKAFMQNLNRWFRDKRNNLIAVGNISKDAISAARAAAPAVRESAAILIELGKLAASVKKKGTKAKAEFDKLKTAVAAIKKDLEAIAALDAPGALKAGVGMATTVGPFVSDCAECAGKLTEATVELVGGGGGGTASLAGCSETFEAYGGSCWGATAYVGIPKAVVDSFLAIPPCESATRGAAQMAKYAKTIYDFVAASVKLAKSLNRNVQNVIKAGKALAGLAKALGSEAKTSVNKIQTSLNKISAATNRSVDIVAGKVAPATARLGASMLSQLGTNVTTLVTCYRKLESLALKMGVDTVRAMAELAVANARLVDGAKIGSNVYRQSARGLSAAEKKARDGWKNLKKREKALYARTWGVPAYQVNVTKTAAHLTKMNPTKARSIVSESLNIKKAKVKLVADSVTAGKRAFLNQDRKNQLKSSKKKFDLALPKARRAEALFKKGTSKKARSARVQRFTPKRLEDVRLALGRKKAPRVDIK